MKYFRKLVILVSFFAVSWVISLWAGNTGKIAGTIIDKATGEAFQEVKIAIEGLSINTLSDVKGQYVILAVPPGKYAVKFSFPEYKDIIIYDVQIDIDQTSWVYVAMELQLSANDTLDLGAENKIIRPDVTTSSVTISKEQVQELPINNVVSAIGLQAGIRGGWNSALASGRYVNQGFGDAYSQGKISVQGDLTIRAGDGDNILFLVDGVTMRDPRNNETLTKIPLSAVKEVSVEKNGFSAEYGQVQSGIVHVISKEGSKNIYSGNLQLRYTPPAPKYWDGAGIRDVQDPYSYLLRPFFDPAVCWTGTDNGSWDYYTQRQYIEFAGWNEFSRTLIADDDPTNDLTPAGAQRVFMYEIRKKRPMNQSDYDIDAGFGGPVPLIGQALGSLRFYTSLRTHREMLLFPLTRPDYRDYDWTLLLNSDLTPAIQLRLAIMNGKQYTIRNNDTETGVYSYPHTAEEIVYATEIQNRSVDLSKLFSDFYFCLADIGYNSISARLTHSLSSKTFYEVSLEHFRREYNVRPPALRDTSRQYEIIPGYFEDSNPFGYWPYQSKGLYVTEGRFSSLARDFTTVSSTTLKAGFSHQLNFQNLLKTGFEFVYHDLHFDYGTIHSGSGGQAYSARVQMNGFPIRGALYAQNKFEISKLTINAGLRLDYSNSNKDWWDVDPFDGNFFSFRYNRLNLTFDKQASKVIWQLSPRFNLAWMIFANSKIFFNYGYFRELSQYETLFRVERVDGSTMKSFGDPSIVPAKTVAYEIGFEQILFADILFNGTIFRKDISNQQDITNYSSIAIHYAKTTANYFETQSGFELTLRKNTGRWLTGFINYTYQENKKGYNGSLNLYEDPNDQRFWDMYLPHYNHDHANPQPYARASINLHTPEEFGSVIAEQKLLGSLCLNILVDWQAGYRSTYNPKNLPDVLYNVKSVDFFNIALRLQKIFDFGKFSLQFFVDMDNVLNSLRLWIPSEEAYYSDNYYYMASLHLPKSEAYDNIPGHDEVGDYRKPGVEYQPMVYFTELNRNTEGQTRPIYYDSKNGQYWQYTDNPNIPVYQRWNRVEQSRIDDINKDKAYIDMPNASTFWFLNPRTIFFGLNVSFHFND